VLRERNRGGWASELGEEQHTGRELHLSSGAAAGKPGMVSQRNMPPESEIAEQFVRSDMATLHCQGSLVDSDRGVGSNWGGGGGRHGEKGRCAPESLPLYLLDAGELS